MYNPNIMECKVNTELLEQMDKYIDQQNEMYSRNINRGKFLDIALIYFFRTPEYNESDVVEFVGRYTEPADKVRTTFNIKNPKNHELLNSYGRFDKRKIIEYAIGQMINCMQDCDNQRWANIMRFYYIAGGVGL